MTVSRARPMVVFLHGFGSDSLSWTFNRPPIDAVADTTSFDLAGHGRAVGDHTGGSIDHLTDHVLEKLAAIRDRRVVLIGHSLGVGVALAAAARRPERVARLLLIAPIGLGAEIDGGFLSEFAELADPTTARQLLSRLVWNPRQITDLMIEHILGRLEETGARGALSDLAARLVADQPGYGAAADRVAELGLERTVIWGKDDRINPIDAARLSAFGGEATILPDTGHLPHMERPAMVNRLMTPLIT